MSRQEWNRNYQQYENVRNVLGWELVVGEAIARGSVVAVCVAGGLAELVYVEMGGEMNLGVKVGGRVRAVGTLGREEAIWVEKDLWEAMLAEAVKKRETERGSWWGKYVVGQPKEVKEKGIEQLEFALTMNSLVTDFIYDLIAKGGRKLVMEHMLVKFSGKDKLMVMAKYLNLKTAKALEEKMREVPGEWKKEGLVQKGLVVGFVLDGREAGQLVESVCGIIGKVADFGDNNLSDKVVELGKSQRKLDMYYLLDNGASENSFSYMLVWK